MNELGFELIKSFESCRLTAYKDPVGIITIGWGSVVPGVELGNVWTQAEADGALSQKVASICDSINSVVTVDLDSNQLSALCSFAYNVGVNNLKMSTLLLKVNKMDFTGATGQFILWDHAGGKALPGLLTRRKAEAALFSGDVATVQAILSSREPS